MENGLTVYGVRPAQGEGHTFRVPLHSIDLPIRPLYRLQDPISGRTGGFLQARRQRFQSLMVRAVDGKFFAIEGEEKAVFWYRNEVNPIAQLRIVFVFFGGFQILNQITAQSHVQNLDSSANSQDRTSPCNEIGYQMKLCRIPFQIRFFAAGGQLPIPGRIDVSTSRQQQSSAISRLGQVQREDSLNAAGIQSVGVVFHFFTVSIYKDLSHRYYLFSKRVLFGNRIPIH